MKKFLEDLLTSESSLKSPKVCAFLRISAATFDVFAEPAQKEGPVRFRRRWHSWQPRTGVRVDMMCCRVSARFGFEQGWHKGWYVSVLPAL